MALASPRRVLIVHSESNVGDSFALLLAMRGFEAVQIGDAAAASQFIRNWRPQVLFVDTLIGDAHDHAPARTLREALTVDRTEGEVELLIALAADAKQDPRDALHAAGYDGFLQNAVPGLVDVRRIEVFLRPLMRAVHCAAARRLRPKPLAMP